MYSVLKVRCLAAVGIREGNTDELGRRSEHSPPALAKFAPYLGPCSIARPAPTSVELGRGTTNS